MSLPACTGVPRTLPSCVSGMATARLRLSDELALLKRTGTDLVGLRAAKVARVGAPGLAAELERSATRLGYLVHAFTGRPEDAEVWSTQVAELAEAVRTCAAVGGDLVYMTSGPSGRLGWEAAADLFTARVAPVVELAGELGVRLAVENTMPVRCDVSFTHTVDAAVALGRMSGMGICLDLYCCWQERRLRHQVAEAIDLVHVVQVSDYRVGTETFPNRWVPGDGDLPMADLLAEVLELGYRGIVDLELVGPAIEEEGAEQAVTRGVAWIRERVAGPRREALAGS